MHFCFDAHGIPRRLSQKTIYGPKPQGLGLHYFKQKQPTRVLDTIHKTLAVLPLLCLPVSNPPSPFFIFSNAKQQLHPHVTTPLIHPQMDTSQAHNVTIDHPYHFTYHLTPHVPVLGYQTWICAGPRVLVSHQQMSWSDGSFQPPKSPGSAAVLSSGRALLCSTPGPPGIYPAELMGIVLAATESTSPSIIYCDNKGACQAVQSNKAVVRHKWLVDAARQSVQSHGHTIMWIKAHNNDKGNELVDALAKAATSLPPQSPISSLNPWDVIHYNLLQLPPHKTWTESMIPRHTHFDCVHKLSFSPLRNHQLIWVNWIFGLMWRPGFQSYFSYWNDTPSPDPCPVCHANHNQSIHGHLAFCSPHGPLHKAWLQAWNTPEVGKWYDQASRKDKHLIGKLVIPQSLYAHLVNVFGRRDARKSITSFQRQIIPLLKLTMDRIAPLPPDWRPDRHPIFNEEDWDLIHPLPPPPLPP
jgi:hypothetical protein